MRVLLLIALMLRLAPTPASASMHCGGHELPAGQGMHVAHGESPAAAGHEECPHCPPADCNLQSHCPQPAGLLFVALVVEPTGAAAGSDRRTEFVRRWTSRGERPPHRPPVPHLT